jgi:hypothetical protein
MNAQPLKNATAVPAIPIAGVTNGTTAFPDSENQALDMLNGGNVPYNLQAALANGDPYTPLMRVQAGDLVKVKFQTGATEHEHSGSIHGVKWLQAGSGNGAAPNSGWRNAQGGGISEQFTFNAPVNLSPDGKVEAITDHAYSVDASQDGWWSGTWGIMRVYQDG